MKRAVILAGGKGTRLRPYTVVLPKPLMPVGEYPILEVIIRQLRSNGFDHVTLAVNHQSELFKAFFGDGSRWDLTIDYSLETLALSTMGPLKLVESLPDNFLVMNGDVLSDVNYGAFLDSHISKGSLFSISASRRTQNIDYGVLHVDSNYRLLGFEEKPKIDYLVSMGVYAVSKRVLESIPSGIPYGFDNLVLGYIERAEPVEVIEHAGYWLDIGRPDDYRKAIEDWPELCKGMDLT